MSRGAVAAVVAAIVGLAIARRRLDVVEVRGRSMEPTLLPGDRLVAVAARSRSVRPGDVVLAADPRDSGRELVKRVARIGADGEWVHLGSDSPLGRSATVAATEVRWRVVARYWPPGRVGRIGPPPPALAAVDEGGEAACAFPEALVAGDGIS